MSDEMEKDAIDVASYALNEFMQESLMANHIKKEFDKKYRCVVVTPWRRRPSRSRASRRVLQTHPAR